MYIIRCGTLAPDDYAHEQSLVFDTENGLVIFNSCSHGGADNIIKEVGATFPNKKLLALIGGFHLFERTDDEVRALAQRIRATGIISVYTGHCTGTRALEILADELGDLVHPFHTGLVMEFLIAALTPKREQISIAAFVFIKSLSEISIGEKNYTLLNIFMHKWV